jgi:hypothetical protein
MARFGLRVLNDSFINDHFRNFNNNFNKSSARLISGNATVVPDKEYSYVFIELDLLAPKVFYFFMLGLLGSTILLGFGAWTIVLGLLSATGYFWTPYPYRWLAVKGLRKKGYHGEVVLF